MLPERINLKSSDIDNEKWWLLPGCGFDVKGQVDKLKAANDFESWLSQTKEDMIGYWAEYLARFPVLPINIKFENGKIIAPKYADSLWINTVSDKERNGAVKESIEKIENFLLDSPSGSMAILTSPPGWSGFEREGNTIVYPETQTYLFRIDENGNLDAVTIITDMSLMQNEKLLEVFELYINKNPLEREQIEDITRNPIFLKATNNKKYSHKEIVREIANVKGTNFARGKITFEDILELLKDRKEIQECDQEVEQKINEFLEKAKNSPVNYEYLEYLLGKTILEIGYISNRISNKQTSRHKIDYKQELKFQQTQAGCNGGGIINTSLGPRKIDEKRILCCECPFCHKKVEAEIYDGKIHCPKCKKEAVWSN